MKKAILLIALCAFSKGAFAQTAPVADTASYSYCELVTNDYSPYESKFKVTIDFGKEQKWIQLQKLTDAKGEVITFHSMVDALNYMVKLKWQFVQAYTRGSTFTNYHYILRHKD